MKVEQNLQKSFYLSPVGVLEITANRSKVTSLHFLNREKETHILKNKDLLKKIQHPVLERCKKELKEYFEGKRKKFFVSVEFLKGTEFQKMVWKALLKIPFGETRSYSQVAAAVGREKAARAVGQACGANPVAIIVPCHRVVGVQGQLTGFGSELWKKKWLLEHESSHKLFNQDTVPIQREK